MARSNSILNLQGTIGGITHVDSKTYGEHTRKARSPGEVNEVLKDNNRQIQNANVAAKLLKDTIDLYRPDFMGGQFWQKLVSHFKKQLKANLPFHVNGLKGTEVKDDYKLDRFFSPQVACSVDQESKTIHLTLNSRGHADFKRKYIDGYKLSVIAVYLNFETIDVKSLVMESPIISISSAYQPVSFSIPIEEDFNQFLICLKIDGCERGKVYEQLTAKGMRIVYTGEIHSSKS